MSRKLRTILISFLVLGLLVSNIVPVSAQDAPLSPSEPSHHIFLPAVSSGGQSDVAQTPTPAGPLGLGAAPAADSIETVEKAEVSASAQLPPDRFRLASVIVVMDEGADPAAAAAAGQGQIVHRYTRIFNGASMVLPEANIGQVANAPGVKAVYLDELRQLDTYRTPEFIGATVAWAALGGQSNAGEGVVVGILDSGVWPENPAFSDPDPSGKPYPAPHGGPYACDFGNTAWNPNDAPFTCNNKLIGAYKFLDTYRLVIGQTPNEFNSARDDDGHGTHTASTAAGNGGVTVSLLGRDLGLISGIAPRAHIIAYKVCGQQGCFLSDSAAAIEQAIRDGVDVLNFSISGGANPYTDVVSQAFLQAYANGVFVAASAGNSGPTANTVNHRGPWVTTVAASTSDRSFLSTVTLYSAGGATLSLVGASLTAGVSTPAPIVINSADPLCQTPAAPGSFAGQIVVCRRGVNPRVEKSANVAAGGAVGMLLYNPTPQGTNTDLHSIPTVHLEAGEGAQLLDFLANNAGVTATFTDGAPGVVQGDVMAGFSSRGGTGQTLGVSKPDITAPGVNILAGYTGLQYGASTPLFNFLSGTSMSSPHIAGVAALLKHLHPDWTPGQIKSAIMTTARVAGVVKEDGVTPINAFDAGSGRVDVAAAMNPGLTFDETAANYMALQNALWNANYPSLYLPNMPGKITVQRTVRSVDPRPRTWRVNVSAPPDVSIVVPKQIRINPGQSVTFDITVDARYVPLGQVRFATIEFVQENQVLRFPVTLVRGEPAVNVSKQCNPAVFPRGARTTCTITLRNTSFQTAAVDFFDQLPPQLSLDPQTVVNATVWGNGVVFQGNLAGAQPPIVTIAATDDSPAGYLPLSLFGVAPIAGVGDETISNFNVPAFTFGGKSWTRVGLVSNGYIVVGGGAGADVQFINQRLPDPARPNNVLAPYWTDLNPAAGGAMRIAILTDGVRQWLVSDWENVREYGSGRPNSFQVWIRLGTVEDITFTYGNVNDGDGGFLTVGAENEFGNSGQNYYYNGQGVLPTAGTELRVSSTPGAPGEVRVITFQAVGARRGAWSNCAFLCSPEIFQGDNIACFNGEVTQR